MSERTRIEGEIRKRLAHGGERDSLTLVSDVSATLGIAQGKVYPVLRELSDTEVLVRREGDSTPARRGYPTIWYSRGPRFDAPPDAPPETVSSVLLTFPIIAFIGALEWLWRAYAIWCVLGWFTNLDATYGLTLGVVIAASVLSISAHRAKDVPSDTVSYAINNAIVEGIAITMTLGTAWLLHQAVG